MTVAPAEMSDDELAGAVAALDADAEPLKKRLSEIQSSVEVLRTEMRRRERARRLGERAGVRAKLAQGGAPTLDEWVATATDADPDAPLRTFRFLRESATEVRLGYAGAADQSIAFTDGTTTEEARSRRQAQELFARGFEFGTPNARGVRIYPAGSRAERVVPASEIRVEAPPGEAR